MKIRYLAAGLLFAFFALSAYSLDRSFPQNAKRGTMSLLLYPSVKIDGQARRLSPGAMIRNQDNLIQTPNSLGAGPYVVNYTQNADGDINQVWILRADEAVHPAPSQNTGAK